MRYYIIIAALILANILISIIANAVMLFKIKKALGKMHAFLEKIRLVDAETHKTNSIISNCHSLIDRVYKRITVVLDREKNILDKMSCGAAYEKRPRTKKQRKRRIKSGNFDNREAGL
jgi:hypothetical protein